MQSPGRELVRSFDGLTNAQQGANNFGTVEPPDQGLCVGNGYVIETVNVALRVYDTQGRALSPTIPMSQFLGYPRDGTTFQTDPSCYYDSDSNRWFHVVMTLGIDQTTFGFTTPVLMEVGVSQTGNPLGGWLYYTIPTQNDGTDGTPDFDCTPPPCFGDFPHFTVDHNGFYLSANEFSTDESSYGGVEIYAVSKQQLIAGSQHPNIVQFGQFDNPSGDIAYKVWPALTPSGQGQAVYFVSTPGCDACPGDHRLIVWALPNTSTLASLHPDLRLMSSVVEVMPFTYSGTVEQRPGPVPLADCINDTTAPTPTGPGCWRYWLLNEPAHNEVESRLDVVGDINQVFFANGRLWTAQNTTLDVAGDQKTGIAWYIIQPSIKAGALNAVVEHEGQFGVAHNNLIFPTAAVTNTGHGVLSFTLVGEDYYPSAAYAPLSGSGVGDVRVAASGLGPVDGFTGYNSLSEPARQRFGDYGAAVAANGSIWFASEYIGQTCTLNEYLMDTKPSPIGTCHGTRRGFGNWYTRVSRVDPAKLD